MHRNDLEYIKERLPKKAVYHEVQHKKNEGDVTVYSTNCKRTFLDCRTYSFKQLENPGIVNHRCDECLDDS